MDTTIAGFLDRLFSEGRVRVAAPQEIGSEDWRGADQVLAAAEMQYRQELPGTPPELAIEPARWAAVLFLRACQFVAFRDLDEDQMDQAFGTGWPGDDSAATHYSVDLIFRYLPDLLRLARRPAEGDPLVKRLQQWADRWPLSSVGIPGVCPASIAAVAGHPSLLCLYADRVIARCDLSRLADRRVRQRVEQSLGAFPDLAPAVAAALASAGAAATERT